MEALFSGCISCCGQYLPSFPSLVSRLPAWSVCFCVLGGISKCYLSSTVPSAVTMATSTGFSSCAALKNVKLTYNAVSLTGAAGPHCCSAAKISASYIPVNSLCSAVLLSTIRGFQMVVGLSHNRYQY